ncbi:MAG: DUF3365 domain-containing protein [Candidatus Nitronauta litoralis]|uniref:DUF3365 domain-containing protein n=1 Tax=Candidatus Nitronauta litoralis TaxID=2705533 RepID=A0A7T0BT65_9BACT|nr:MAG: DUF3365 domain-containing protein [Candidatus Nitronauta litoralis]
MLCRKMRSTLLTAGMAAFFFGGPGLILESWALSLNEKKEIALEITQLFRSARAVISEYQQEINDSDIGDKNLPPEKVIEEAKQHYERDTGKEFRLADGASLKGVGQKAMLNAIDEVMSNAQPLINERGRGYKGFLPAVFARLVADRFNRLMKQKAFIKLTAPNKYIRNRSNQPDRWEASIIDNKFGKTRSSEEKPFVEETRHRGRSAFRLIIPEYYNKTCLPCHGGNRNERDITGARKEGGKLGELGGAISFVIYN